MHLSVIALTSLLALGALAEAPSRVLQPRASQAHPGIPACTTVATTPKPDHLKCGAEGRVHDVTPIEIFTAKNFKACTAACLDDAKCASYAFKTTNKACSLFSKAIIRQDFSKAPTSKFFYNRSCYKIICKCDSQLASCGDYCANLLKDPSNCGACGHVCGEFETCSAGRCVTTTCSQVIDCDAGIFGKQVECDDVNRTCYCLDVDGSSDVGLCTPSEFCSDLQRCASSADCGPDHFCSLKSCCGFGVCSRANLSHCANQFAPSRIFKRGGSPSHKTTTGLQP